MLDLLKKNIATLLAAIDDCYERRQLLPCLILIYSGIDVLASLEKEDSEGTGTAFQRWTSRYLRPENSLYCSSSDLYGARCGIVHAMSSKSDYSVKGKAKEIVYAWGKGNPEKLKLINNIYGKNYIVLHIDDLNAAFKSGIIVYLSEISIDLARSGEVAKRAGVWLSNMDRNTLDKVLNKFGVPDT